MNIKKKRTSLYMLTALFILCMALMLTACGGGTGGTASDLADTESTGQSDTKETGSSDLDDTDIETYSMNDFVMSTVLGQTIYGTKDLTGDIKDLLDNLENEQLSWRVSESTVARCNAAGKEGKALVTDAAFAGWVEKSLTLAEKSGGAFDPSIGELTRLWDIEGDNPKVPEEEDLARVMEKIGYQNIHVDTETKEVSLDAGATLDLGAVGKGIACDVVRDYLDENKDLTRGAVISVGGSILVYGSKPSGDPWSVAIQDPRGQEGEYMGVLSIDRTTNVSTSGDYEKYFEENGKRYHHILDPKSGYPAESGLISVTVVCDDGLLSDGLSTACFVLGRDQGMDLLEEYGAEGIFIDEEKNVTITDGLAHAFTILNDDYKQ